MPPRSAIVTTRSPSLSHVVQAVAQGRVFAALRRHGSLEVAQRRAFATRRDGKGMPLRVRRVAFHVLRRLDELALAVRKRAVVRHVHFGAIDLWQGSNTYRSAPGMVHDALAVAVGEADKILGLIGKALNALPACIARVQVADALMVGQKTRHARRCTAGGPRCRSAAPAA